jgi:CRISPR-associated protein Cas2
MIVLTMTDCPIALRGDLTKWLLEISAGVFVGKVSARVRENLWERVEKYVQNGRATMVYSAKNEQGLDFRVHSSDWEPIDFDGLKLILRPKLSRVSRQYSARRPGYSKASQRRAAAQAQKRRATADAMSARPYVVVDIETTGLKPDRADIFAIGALRVEDGTVTDDFNVLVRTKNAIPQSISELTGVTSETVERDGVDLKPAIMRFLEFVGNLPLVAHNASFDVSFLNAACRRCGLDELQNERIDTLAMARRLLPELNSHTLQSLLERFGIENEQMHTAGADCRATHLLYEKLIKFEKPEVEKP